MLIPPFNDAGLESHDAVSPTLPPIAIAGRGLGGTKQLRKNFETTENNLFFGELARFSGRWKEFGGRQVVSKLFKQL
ncbi:hypothetical protein [Trueperella pecoris]|uniref:hypothetical protein n=1 Tax=Trueperella pecoris TaxID=2733571 RepID=UPI00186B9464|nr:hypothetical protein [Trueperella pecoris]QOQ39761.1 hypothetical protein HLG82_10140 [Trueperella pecoris]